MADLKKLKKVAGTHDRFQPKEKPSQPMGYWKENSLSPIITSIESLIGKENYFIAENNEECDGLTSSYI